MARVTSTDRKATAAEVRAHAADVRRIALQMGLPTPRVRDDGTLIITSQAPGYSDAIRLSQSLSGLVDAYVHVITDDGPAVTSASPL